MGNWNSGSVALEVFSYVDNVPTNISGALINIVGRKVARVEEYTGLSIGTTAILPKYQDVILYFTLADVYKAINDRGADVASIKLGDFQTSKTTNSTASELMKSYKQEAEDMMNDELGYDSKSEQVFN